MTRDEAYVVCVALATISPSGMILHSRYELRKLPSPHELLNKISEEHKIDVTSESFAVDVQAAAEDVVGEMSDDMFEDERDHRELGN